MLPEAKRATVYTRDRKQGRYAKYDDIYLNISTIFSQNVLLYHNVLIFGTLAPKQHNHGSGLLLYDFVNKYEEWLDLPFSSGPCGLL